MVNSSHYVEQRLHRSVARKITRIARQIDSLTEVFARLLHSDFLSLFHSSEHETELIPIAFKSSLKDSTDIKNTEKFWPHNSEVDKFAPNGLFRCDDLAACLTEFEQKFAQENSLQYRYLLVQRRDDGTEFILSAFWRSEPEKIDSEKQSTLEILLDSLSDFLSFMKELRQTDSFMVRLASLLSIAESRLVVTEINKIPSQIVHHIQEVADFSGAAIFQKSLETSPLCIIGHSTDANNLNYFSNIVTQSLIPAVLSSQGAPITKLIEMPDGTSCTLALVDISPSDKQQSYLLVWQYGSDSIDAEKLELLSIYTLIATTLLSNSLLVSELKVSNLALKKSSIRMANLETLAALADMTSGLAHDFNNIIGGVVGRVQLLKMKIDDPQLQKGLSKIESQVLEGALTVQRIQEFVTSSRYKNLEPLDICQVIDKAINREEAGWRIEARQRNINIQTTYSVDMAIIDGFAPDILTVIDKLIENAVEHSPDNSDVNVIIEASQQGFNLVVIDQGEGIDLRYKERIFYPFFSTKREKGAGMSLATVHGIVVRHGGKIKAARAPRRGTIITVTFRKPKHDDPLSETSRRIAVKKELDIIVVDDDQQMREVLADMLTMDGHKATICADGYRAMEAFQKETFDLMITDLGMPGMSGMQLSSLVHADDPQMPIAMITGWGTQLNEDEIKQCGVQRVLSKPFHLAEMREVITELTSSSNKEHSAKV